MEHNPGLQSVNNQTQSRKECTRLLCDLVQSYILAVESPMEGGGVTSGACRESELAEDNDDGAGLRAG